MTGNVQMSIDHCYMYDQRPVVHFLEISLATYLVLVKDTTCHIITNFTHQQISVLIQLLNIAK